MLCIRLAEDRSLGESRHFKPAVMKERRWALAAKQGRMETEYVPMISLGMQNHLLLLLPWGRCGNSGV